MRRGRRIGMAITVAALTTSLAGCGLVSTAETSGRSELAAAVSDIQQWAWSARAGLAGDPAAMLTVAPEWLVDLPAAEGRLDPGRYVVGVATDHEGASLDLVVPAVATSGGGWFVDEWDGVTCLTLRVGADRSSIRMDDADCGPLAARLTGYRSVSARSLGLPTTLDASTMPADPPEPLSQSARVRVLTALAEETTAAAVEDRLLRLLTQANVTIAVAEEGGEIGAAVGAAGTRDCVLAVRLGDGSVIEPSYDTTWAQPGETGCSPDLYFHPPL